MKCLNILTGGDEDSVMGGGGYYNVYLSEGLMSNSDGFKVHVKAKKN